MKTAEEIMAEIKYQSTLPEGDQWIYESFLEWAEDADE